MCPSVLCIELDAGAEVVSTVGSRFTMAVLCAKSLREGLYIATTVVDVLISSPSRRLSNKKVVSILFFYAGASEVYAGALGASGGAEVAAINF